MPELAVIVAVLVCGLAVALPSLQKARETARQNTCREHLKTLAVAILSHNDQQQRFPAGQVARRAKSNSVGRYADPEEPRDAAAASASGASWVVAVLPGIDQKALYDQWDQKRSVAANRQAAETDLSLLFCPSRRGGGLMSGCDRVGDDWSRGGSDFAACNGSGISFQDEARQTWDLDEMQLTATSRDGQSPYSCAAANRGVFGVNSQVTGHDVEVADGRSYVLLLAERRVFRNITPNEQRSSDGWAWGGPATLFSTRFAPHTGRHYDEADSDHPGLVNVAMVDSRIRPVSWNIDLRTWSNLGNFAQGSPLEHPEFR